METSRPGRPDLARKTRSARLTRLTCSIVDKYIRHGYICRGLMKALTSAVSYVLLALAAEPRHGYGIQKEILRLTGGDVRLGPGTLYGTLQRLMEAGWVEENEGRGNQEDERRRYYRLSRTGRVALEAEAKRLEALVRTARARHVLPRASRG